MNIVGTPYSARTALLSTRGERRRGIEARCRDHHRRAVRGAAEVAHHHPEAVVERHGDTEPVLLGETAVLAHEVPVVENVAVAECRSFGEAGRSARVLDVDRVHRVKAGGDAVDPLRIDPLALGQEARPLVSAQEHDAFERVKPATDLADHRPVVRALERLRRDQHPASGLPERILELGGPIGGVEVDEDHPELGRRVLNERPLVPVRAPDPHPIGRPHAGAEERAGDSLDRRTELPPAQPHVLRTRHERVAVGPSRDRPVEVRADRLLQQRGAFGPSGVRLSHRISPRCPARF